MTIEEIFAGESDSLEFKVDVPPKMEKYMKTVVAFANGAGGRIVFGVENGTWKVKGFSKDEIFQKMDAITNAIYDSCEPKITPGIGIQEIDGKSVIVVNIIPGMQRPYYIRSQGILDGTYVRVAGTTRQAARYRIQELILEGTNRSFDQLERDKVLSEKEIDTFCERMYQHALELCNSGEARAQIREVTRNQLLSWKVIVEKNGAFYPTNAYLLLDGCPEEFPEAAIQCAVFKGTVRDIFITRKEFTGSRTDSNLSAKKADAQAAKRNLSAGNTDAQHAKRNLSAGNTDAPISGAQAADTRISAAQLQYISQLKKHRNTVRFFRLFLFLLLITLWEICSECGVINSFIFSSPSRMLGSAAQLLKNGQLLAHTGVTLAETFLSFFLVAGVSLLAAVLLWWNNTLSEILEPWFVILNSLPKSAMAPIFIVWLGNNMKTIIITGISVAIFGSILNLFTSFASTDPDKLKLIRTLHGTRADCLTRVVLPMNLPAVLSILKVDIGLCLIGVVIGEFLAARQGLGYLIIYGSQVFKMDWVMLSIVLLCLIAALLYGGLTRLEKHFAK